jgi:L-ascorbate peroxidase
MSAAVTHRSRRKELRSTLCTISLTFYSIFSLLFLSQVRLAWHDSGTYNHYVGLENWPRCGGANGSDHAISRHTQSLLALYSPPVFFFPIGSIRFELCHESNTGLDGAITLLQPLKDQFPAISWADLFQLAAATAIEFSGLDTFITIPFLTNFSLGGPKIAQRYGRIDVNSTAMAMPPGNLPAAAGPWATTSQGHLREVSSIPSSSLWLFLQ